MSESNDARGSELLARWWSDPACFGEQVFGIKPWSRQREIMDAVARYPRVSVRSGHKTGKAIALDTEILTPNGWRQLGELEVGDEVFDETGRPCRIVQTSIWFERPVFRLTFDDGTSVIADECHEWMVRRETSSELLETRELFERSSTERFPIDLPGPLQLPPQQLEADPYLLGLKLREQHIPEPYLLASADQRLALLQGLMDAGGRASEGGSVAWRGASGEHADAVAFLARSLGAKVRISRRHRAQWEVQWVGTFPAFRHLYKARMRSPAEGNAPRHIAIERVEPLAERRTTKCIEVDSPSHLFLCSRSLIATHNSLTFAVVALWWAMTRREPRVILLAPTHRQIQEIVWREITTLFQRRARVPLGGVCYAKPEEGIRWPNGGQIFGFSTDRKENVAGYSGNILYLLDEASGIPDMMHEVVATSPTGKVAMISNPTRNSGAFYRSHHSGRDIWRCVHISSEEAARENPVVTLPSGERRALIPGVADEDWIAARRAEYGESSYFYDVRVRGEFSKEESNVVIPLGLVTAAIDRHADVPADGQLCIGVDVARFGNDDSSLVPRRGRWTGPVEVHHGSDNVQVAGKVLMLADRYRRPGERVSVRVDTSSGGGVADILRRHEGLDVVDVMAQERARDPQYARRRDEVWFAMRQWLREGGIVAGDERLVGDLVAPIFDWDESGRIKVEGKRTLRKRLGRSTDRADALALAVMPVEVNDWDPDFVNLTERD